jgi:hypothetical protein
MEPALSLTGPRLAVVHFKPWSWLPKKGCRSHTSAVRLWLKFPVHRSKSWEPLKGEQRVASFDAFATLAAPVGSAL